MKIWLPHDPRYYALEKFAQDVEVVNATTGLPKNIRDCEFVVLPMFDLHEEFRLWKCGAHPSNYKAIRL